ncbi:unnamed protein product, partial [Ectocarpus fasciculatus]
MKKIVLVTLLSIAFVSFGNAQGKSQEKAKEMKEKGKEKADKAKEDAEVELKDAQEKLEEGKGKGKEKAKEIKDKSKEKADKAKDKVKDSDDLDDDLDKVKENKGNAHGRDKGDMTGKEFGQFRASQAKERLEASEKTMYEDEETLTRGKRALEDA